MTSIVTALTAVAALVYTNQTLRLTEQGQYTDRSVKAVEQLGKQGPDQLYARLGGVNSLRLLMRDSPEEQLGVVKVLTAFIRSAAPRPPGGTCPGTEPAADVQGALDVLNSRDRDLIEPHGRPVIDLSGTCLRRADLSNADLRSAALTGADLSQATMRDADLSGANLRAALLRTTDLVRANLTEVYLRDADLTGVNLSDAALFKATLSDAKLDDAYLTGADLADVSLTRAYLAGANLLGADLRRSYLDEADLTGVDLRGADLTGAAHNSGTRVDGVITDENTFGTWW
ncbi:MULTISPECIES: pentapeptide repeat-containing protein [Actinosynnema]|uniref:pentapeptide repeat-containing protein n=1 Tax=Actinosynnema TaxID=40566 RepID=UPI0020A45038|nr:pentapeptide repeat-containing protein [Actinosynnema pretiosum]MCP2099921.1 Uncharacterized protein YjbI, contains pentapeptide repeats [Actinosynnema pretiosum]